MKIRRVLILVGIVVIAALLAFRLSGAVYAMIVLPVSYLLWLLKLFFLAVPGIIWWGALVLVVLYILLMSLVSDIKIKRKMSPANRRSRGNVEILAGWMARSKKGTYFKWLVANRLGRIAHQILENRSAGKKRSFFDPLTGSGWDADAPTQAYLESGLQGSFADYPRRNSYFSKPVQTPLDQNTADVITYLESQVDDQ